MDVLHCSRFLTRVRNLPRLWLYLLECQELDPLWKEGIGKAELLLGWRAKTVVRIKWCKVLKFLVNTMPSLYVQVQSHW